MRYLNFYNRKFIKLQSCSLGMLQGMAFVFFAAELYATAVLVYVRAPPAAPTMGLFTAFLTIISVRPVYAPALPPPPIQPLTPLTPHPRRLSSFPDAFLKTVLFQSIWPRELSSPRERERAPLLTPFQPAILLALWLLTATSHHDLSAALAPHGCDTLPAGLTPHLHIVCTHITSLQLQAYLAALVLMVYSAALSVLTVQALEADHPGVWHASTWELPYPQGAPPTKSNGGEDAPAAPATAPAQ
ncbi:hypothetical protein EYR36_009093 [Pleurotus pulmonarius]|nr:hypothetical protein EYR36_009093 [Pleurotus pulmonarius]